MKECICFSIVLWLGAIQVGRPQQSIETGAQAVNPTALRASADDLASDGRFNQTNAIVRKHVTVSGPLVQPFKAKRLREVPKRLWHLVNPFAPAEPKPAYERTPALSTRAWSTTVGWSPGRSAFPDAVTHESTLSLVSFSGTQ
jgi:hypothetical protein